VQACHPDFSSHSPACCALGWLLAAPPANPARLGRVVLLPQPKQSAAGKTTPQVRYFTPIWTWQFGVQAAANMHPPEQKAFSEIDDSSISPPSPAT
jgi:hypothetical protein